MSESFDAKTNTYTYTVVIKNTGNIVTDYFVTAQPYNDKSLGADGKPKDSAKRQIQKVTLGGFQKTTVKFTFTGAEGKDWKFKYTDIYNSDPTKGGATMIAGDIGEFAFRPVAPGALLDEVFAFQFPYPYAATLAVEDVARKALGIGIKNVEVFVKGPGSGRDSALRAIRSAGLSISMIADTTPIPHNGPRAKKKRRI